MTYKVLLAVPRGFTVPDSLQQLNPDETAECLNYLVSLIGTFRKTAAQPSVVKDLFQEIEVQYQEEKQKELAAQRLSLIDKHEHACTVLRQ